MKRWFSFPRLNDSEAKRLDAAVDQRLRSSVTLPPKASPWLHASIMSAVRQSASVEPARGFRFRLAWALPVVMLVLLAGWLALKPADPQAGGLAGGEMPAPVVSQVAWQGAALTVQPLDDELTNLGRDWERTQEFLLASLP